MSSIPGADLPTTTSPTAGTECPTIWLPIECRSGATFPSTAGSSTGGGGATTTTGAGSGSGSSATAVATSGAASGITSCGASSTGSTGRAATALRVLLVRAI